MLPPRPPTPERRWVPLSDWCTPYLSITIWVKVAQLRLSPTGVTASAWDETDVLRVRETRVLIENRGSHCRRHIFQEGTGLGLNTTKLHTCARRIWWVAEGLEVLLVLACYVSSLFLRRPPLDPPAVINHPGWKPAEKRMAPSGKKKEKPKERPDAATMVSHFVKRKKKRERKKTKHVHIIVPVAQRPCTLLMIRTRRTST